MMNVSRVSIRAALQHLRTRGFVASVQGGGTRVLAASNGRNAALTELVRVNRNNLSDLAEMRAGIEVWAARRAAERGSDEQIGEIDAVYRAMSQPHRPPRHKAQDDFNFHMAIAKASGSAVYMHLMSVLSEILEDMFAYHRYDLQAGPGYDRLLLDQHRAISLAIRKRDGDAAARAMAAHHDTILASYAQGAPHEGAHAGATPPRSAVR